MDLTTNYEKLTLREIAERREEIGQEIMKFGGEIPEWLEESFDLAEMIFSKKIDRCVQFKKSTIPALRASLQTALEKLDEREKQFDEYMKWVLMGEESKRLHGLHSLVRLQKNAASLEIADGAKTPPEYTYLEVSVTAECDNTPEKYENILGTLQAAMINLQKDSGINATLDISITPKKDAIKAALRLGQEIPGHRLIEDKCHVRYEPGVVKLT